MLALGGRPSALRSRLSCAGAARNALNGPAWSASAIFTAQTRFELARDRRTLCARLAKHCNKKPQDSLRSPASASSSMAQPATGQQ